MKILAMIIITSKVEIRHKKFLKWTNTPFKCYSNEKCYYIGIIKVPVIDITVPVIECFVINP